LLFEDRLEFTHGKNISVVLERDRLVDVGFDSAQDEGKYLKFAYTKDDELAYVILGLDIKIQANPFIKAFEGQQTGSKTFKL